MMADLPTLPAGLIVEGAKALNRREQERLRYLHYSLTTMTVYFTEDLQREEVELAGPQQ